MFLCIFTIDQSSIGAAGQRHEQRGLRPHINSRPAVLIARAGTFSSAHHAVTTPRFN